MAATPRAARLKSRQEAEAARRIPCPYRVGDTVYILSGRSKGRKGPFKKYDPKRNLVYVEGCNQIEHYVKARPDGGREGGRQKTDMPVHVSSTAAYCLDCDRPTSFRRRSESREEDGRALTTVSWVCRRCGSARPAAKRK
jgi:large subunit ribosomal protein L24